jgi:hypothetical protein
MKKKIVCLVAAAFICSGSAVLSARPAADRPTLSGSGPLVTGPIKGGERGYPFGAYFGDIRSIGYVEEEFFIEGTATHYVPVTELTSDGKWNLRPQDPAAYKTRILVRRPQDPARFNGTVVVEWVNVSFGYELAFHEPPGLYTNGFAYVSVSAQPTGIDGYPSNPQGLRAWDGGRYGTLHISDDGLSYDVFTQAALAVGPNRENSARGSDPMNGLAVRKLIAVGASQSGSRILAYTNGVQPLTNAFDALIPAICAGSASDFSTAMGHADPGSGDTSHSRSIMTRVREDLTVPVLQLNSQTEAFYYARQHQPETDTFRSYEIPGASHMPRRQTFLGRLKTDRDGVSDFTRAYTAVRTSEAEWFPVFDAALLHVHRWITDGTKPPSFPPVQLDGNDYAYDQYGNVLGGVRIPELEVPAARYAAAATLPLGGYTIPFTTERLKELYPTHEIYVEKIRAAAVKARDAGIILPGQVDEYVKAAEAAPIPEEPETEVKAEIRATPGGSTR